MLIFTSVPGIYNTENLKHQLFPPQTTFKMLLNYAPQTKGDIIAWWFYLHLTLCPTYLFIIHKIIKPSSVLGILNVANVLTLTQETSSVTIKFCLAAGWIQLEWFNLKKLLSTFPTNHEPRDIFNALNQTLNSIISVLFLSISIIQKTFLKKYTVVRM